MKVLRSLTAVILLACFLVAPASTLSMVLCVRADGHITLEAAHNGRCSSPFIPTGMLLQEAQHDSHTNHCGPCIDVPLSTDETKEQLSAAFSPLSQLDAPVLALVTCFLSVSLDLPTLPLGLCALPAVSTTLRAIRTVMLLL